MLSVRQHTMHFVRCVWHTLCVCVCVFSTKHKKLWWSIQQCESTNGDNQQKQHKTATHSSFCKTVVVVCLLFLSFSLICSMCLKLQTTRSNLHLQLSGKCSPYEFSPSLYQEAGLTVWFRKKVASPPPPAFVVWVWAHGGAKMWTLPRIFCFDQRSRWLYTQKGYPTSCYWTILRGVSFLGVPVLCCFTGTPGGTAKSTLGVAQKKRQTLLQPLLWIGWTPEGRAPAAPLSRRLAENISSPCLNWDLGAFRACIKRRWPPKPAGLPLVSLPQTSAHLGVSSTLALQRKGWAVAEMFFEAHWN